jgi:hypothetical protein
MYFSAIQLRGSVIAGLSSMRIPDAQVARVPANASHLTSIRDLLLNYATSRQADGAEVQLSRADKPQLQTSFQWATLYWEKKETIFFE